MIRRSPRARTAQSGFGTEQAKETNVDVDANVHVDRSFDVCKMRPALRPQEPRGMLLPRQAQAGLTSRNGDGHGQATG